MPYQCVEITPQIRNAVKKAAEAATAYENLTNRKLGITGEIGEVLVCDALNLRLLSDPLSAGFDAINQSGTKKYQIKSRRSNHARGRIGRFSEHRFDYAILAILDVNYSLVQLYQVSEKDLLPILNAQPRRNPSFRQFKRIAKEMRLPSVKKA